MDKDTITAILNWPIPKSVKDIRVKFIKNYGSIAAPFSDLVKKDLYLWDQLALNAFNNLKEALTTVLVLVLTDFTTPFVVECDTSGIVLGIVLLQQGHLVAFFSKVLHGKNMLLSTYEALVLAVQKWRHYLLGRTFTFRIDHWSLKFLWEQTIHTIAQQTWRVKLLGCDFVIEYRHGRKTGWRMPSQDKVIMKWLQI